MTKSKKRPFNPPHHSREIELLLESKALRGWCKRLEGYLRFLSELKRLKNPKSPAWVKGNRDHYIGLVENMIEYPPKGVEHIAAKAKKLLPSL